MAASLKRPTQFHHDAHPYVPDRVTDHRGRDRCERCGLDRTHRWHRLPATDPAVTEMEARRTGERTTAGTNTNNPAEGTPA